MTWKDIINTELEKEYFGKISTFLREDRKQYRIFPEYKNVFRAFDLCPLDDVKILLLGQNPYHAAGQAMGLSFSVPKHCVIPPSLRNIYKEINDDLGLDHKFEHGDLTGWAKQGLLLLNSSLTVREGQASSHKDIWGTFTDKMISVVNGLDRPIVYMLWGSWAKEKTKLLNNKKHLVLTAVHPSPLSAYNGWFGSKCFSRANKFLKDNRIKEIDWRL
jgi:uracil-DNA glycosylase